MWHYLPEGGVLKVIGVDIPFTSYSAAPGLALIATEF